MNIGDEAVERRGLESFVEPEVTVVIAARNESRYVDEAVQSILAQTGVALELIFVEDHSDDDTFEKVAAIAEQDDRLTLARNPGRGKVRAFNHGVERAKAPWICLFAGDDIMPPGALATRVQAVRAAKEQLPVLGVCRLITMSDDPKNDGHLIPRDPNKGTFSGLCYMFSREAVAAMWPIPEDLPNEDTWLEVAAMHLDLNVVHSGVIGARWRLHTGNSINYMLSFEEFNRRLTPRMAAAERFLEAHGDKLSDERRRALEGRVACEDARRRGDLIGVLTSRVSLVDKLRAAALSNAVLYGLRARLYGLLSGW